MTAVRQFVIVGNVYAGFRKMDALLAEVLPRVEVQTLDPTDPQSIVLSEECPGARLLLDPRLVTPKLLDAWAQSLPTDALIIHLQSDYTQTLRMVQAEADGDIEGPEADIV